MNIQDGIEDSIRRLEEAVDEVDKLLGPEARGDGTPESAPEARKRFINPLLDLCPGLRESHSDPEISGLGRQIALELPLM